MSGDVIRADVSSGAWKWFLVVVSTWKKTGLHLFTDIRYLALFYPLFLPVSFDLAFHCIKYYNSRVCS